LAVSSTDVAAASAYRVDQSVPLRKELGFADLFLASILLVVIPDFFGSAVKAGAAHVLLWLLAIALFFVPQALVVAYLKERLPLEGGLYEWARHGFGDAIGFLTAWGLPVDIAVCDSLFSRSFPWLVRRLTRKRPLRYQRSPTLAACFSTG
jgi:Amino acid permease